MRKVIRLQSGSVILMQIISVMYLRSVWGFAIQIQNGASEKIRINKGKRVEEYKKE